MGVVEYAKNLAASIPQNNGFTMSPALLGAAGSVINGALGFFGQQSANKTNLKIARETNAANRANQEYQNEWNLDMWNKQNEYNSPAAMRQRLEAAGLNPIFNGLDGVSEAGQLQSADYVATPGAPMLNSGEFLGNGIGNAMKTMAEINLLEKQAKKTESETELNELERSVQSQLAEGRVTMQGVQIDFVRSQTNLNDEQVKNVAQNTQYISQLQSESVAKVEQMGKDYDLRKLQYDLDKWYKEEEIRIKNSGLALDQQRFAFEKLKFQQEIAVAWYRSYSERQQVTINGANSLSQRAKNGAEIKFINGKVSMQGLEAREIAQRILTGASVSYKNYHDAKVGSGILGSILNFSSSIAEFFTGDNPIDNMINNNFNYDINK